MNHPKRLIELDRHGVLATAAAGVLTREEAQVLIERAIRLSKADAIRVNLQSGREANLRFADNQMSTSGVSTTTSIRIQSVFGKRRASVVTNNRTDEGLRRAVEQSEALARLAPEDPEYQDWFENMETEFERTVMIVAPGFVDELAAVSESAIDEIGRAWGPEIGYDPETAITFLRQMTEIAREARASGLRIYTMQFS